MAALRDTKKKKCEDAIFRTAMELFTEKGYEQTTIRDIAEKSEVAVGTLYNYYKSKSDILMSMLSFHRESIERNANQYLVELESRETKPTEAIQGLFYIFTEAFTPFKKSLWRDILSVAYKDGDALNGQLWVLQKGFFVQTEKLVTHLQIKNIINPGMEPQLISNTLYGLFFVQFLRFINTSADIGEILHYLSKQFELVLGGMEV